MATSDLQGELAKEHFKTDGETEEKLCQAILQQLDDISGDISGMAVKWQVCLSIATKACPAEYLHWVCCSLGLLVRKIADPRLQDISESLCKRVTNASGKKTEQRDIATIGLKTVIAEVSGSQAAALVSYTTPRLVDGLNKPVSATPTCDASLS